MKTAWLLLVATTVGLTSCSNPPVRPLSLPQRNPTSYTFRMPVTEFLTGATQALTFRHQIQEPMFAPVDGRTAIFSVEDSKKHLFAPEALFRDPANTNDLYLHNHGSPIAPSSVYRDAKEGLAFFASFHLHLTDAGTNITIATVTALDTRIANGWYFGLNIHTGFGRQARIVAASPTTVEEYAILLYLGRYLGVTDMPELIVPSP